MTAANKKRVWLIQDPFQPDPIGPLLKRLIGAKDLMVFPSLEEALLQSDNHPPPQLILMMGVYEPGELSELRDRVHGAPLLGVIPGEDDIEAGGPSADKATTRDALKHDYGFTGREKQVLSLMVQGFIKKEIACHLSLSFHTVNNHERRIFKKLNVHSRSAAVAKALIENLA